MEADSTHIDHQFADKCENRIHLDPVKTTISHIADATHLSQKQQFTLLSTILNYHCADLPSIDNVQKIIKGGSSSYVSHFMSWQGTEENYKYPPGSPCNRIMHYIIEDYSLSVHNLVKYLYNKDNGLEEENPEIPQLDDQPDSQPPSRKKKKISLPAVSVAPGAISNGAGVDLNQLLNSAKQNSIQNLKNNS